MIEIALFHKDDCGLCDQVHAELMDFIQRHDLENKIRLQLLDILERSEWYDQYSDRIPVILANNQEICHYFFDEPAVCKALGITPKNPSGE